MKVGLETCSLNDHMGQKTQDGGEWVINCQTSLKMGYRVVDNFVKIFLMKICDLEFDDKLNLCCGSKTQNWS